MVTWIIATRKGDASSGFNKKLGLKFQLSNKTKYLPIDLEMRVSDNDTNDSDYLFIHFWWGPSRAEKSCIYAACSQCWHYTNLRTFIIRKSLPYSAILEFCCYLTWLRCKSWGMRLKSLTWCWKQCKIWLIFKYKKYTFSICLP